MSVPRAGQPGITRDGRQPCVEAERLERLELRAADEAARLRDARRLRAAVERELHGGLALADRRALVEAKLEALQHYRQSVEAAQHPGAVMAAVAAWLGEINQLNRAAALAAAAEPAVSARLREVTARVERLEIEAARARVAAEIARRACLDSRSAFGGGGLPARATTVHRPQLTQSPPIEALLAGQPATLPTLVNRLAAQTGGDVNRLGLQLLELREAVVEVACDEGMLDFPAGHPFWGQFELAEARAVAAGLAVVGRGFDGRDGWRGGRAAEPRELAVALSLAGFDLRSLHRRPTRAELERLWRGAAVAAVALLHDRAPDLGREALCALIGPREEPLAELWADWARLRPLLLGEAQLA